MKENNRLYPISEDMFNQKILPVIEGCYIWNGRPPKVSHYRVFCGIPRILRTGCPWRDLPEEFGYWHLVYERFAWGSERGLWAKILLSLQQEEGIEFKEVIIDSTTMKVHRHGGGQKRGGGQKKCVNDYTSGRSKYGLYQRSPCRDAQGLSRPRRLLRSGRDNEAANLGINAAGVGRTRHGG
jgi:transposase